MVFMLMSQQYRVNFTWVYLIFFWFFGVYIPPRRLPTQHGRNSLVGRANTENPHSVGSIPRGVIFLEDDDAHHWVHKPRRRPFVYYNIGPLYMA